MNWPEQKVVVRLQALHATKIRQAFKSAIDGDAVAQAWVDTHPAGGSVSPQTARDWALAQVMANEKPLQYALSRIYADGYTLGAKVAETRLNGLKKDASIGVVDWSTWKPGSPSAAALVRPRGGLKQLLDSRKITVANEITRTKLDRIGTALARSLNRGDTAKETAKSINAIIGDPQHALTIAQTEMSRAMSVASRDEYEKSNVEQVEWLVAEGCEDCQENADASPIGIDETFPTGDSEPPAHPNCMCALAPYYDDNETNVSTEDDSDLLDFASEAQSIAEDLINEESVRDEFVVPEPKYAPRHFTQDKFVELLPKTPEGTPNFDAPFIGRLNSQATSNIIKEQNLLNPVPIIEPDKFDNLVDNGWAKFYRGYTAKSESELNSYIDNFTHGENPYVTSGMYGNGTYFGSSRVARAYAEADLGGKEVTKGRVIEIALNPKAKVITEKEAGALQNEWVRNNKELAEKYIPNMSDIAISRGYDAMRIVNTEVPDGSDDYLVIFNRGALVMKK